MSNTLFMTKSNKTRCWMIWTFAFVFESKMTECSDIGNDNDSSVWTGNHTNFNSIELYTRHMNINTFCDYHIIPTIFNLKKQMIKLNYNLTQNSEHHDHNTRRREYFQIRAYRTNRTKKQLHQLQSTPTIQWTAATSKKCSIDRSVQNRNQAPPSSTQLAMMKTTNLLLASKFSFKCYSNLFQCCGGEQPEGAFWTMSQRETLFLQPKDLTEHHGCFETYFGLFFSLQLSFLNFIYHSQTSSLKLMEFAKPSNHMLRET